MRQRNPSQSSGFTLIEISIVLVIIGLIVGGILVGRDLISASEVRAQISQIEKYNSAVNTFSNKYGGLPGDLNLTLVAQFGFSQGANCNGTQGFRDGNGLLDGWASPNNLLQTAGETGLFWSDLSSSGLIGETIPNNSAPAVNCNSAKALTMTPGTAYIGDYMPAAKIGYGNFISVYQNNGANWYGICAITATSLGGTITSTGTIPVIQAYNMDKKVDDGLPTTGAIRAVYLNALPVVTNSTNNASDTTSTCYNTTGVGSYSISASANQGAGLNCALSFKFE